MKLLILSNFTFFHNVFQKIFSSVCWNEYILWKKWFRTLVVSSVSEFNHLEFPRFLLFSDICFFLSRATIMSIGNNSDLTFYQTSACFFVSAVQIFRKHRGKWRNCSWHAISPFLTMFSNLFEKFQLFSSNSKLLPANSFRFEETKVCHFGKGYCITEYVLNQFFKEMRTFEFHRLLSNKGPDLFSWLQNFIPFCIECNFLQQIRAKME